MAGLELGRRVEGDIFSYHSAIYRLSKVIGKGFLNIPNPTNIAQIICIQPRNFGRVAHIQDSGQV